MNRVVDGGRRPVYQRVFGALCCRVDGGRPRKRRASRGRGVPHAPEVSPLPIIHWAPHAAADPKRRALRDRGHPGTQAPRRCESLRPPPGRPGASRFDVLSPHRSGRIAPHRHRRRRHDGARRHVRGRADARRAADCSACVAGLQSCGSRLRRACAHGPSATSLGVSQSPSRRGKKTTVESWRAPLRGSRHRAAVDMADACS